MRRSTRNRNAPSTSYFEPDAAAGATPTGTRTSQTSTGFSSSTVKSLKDVSSLPIFKAPVCLVRTLRDGTLESDQHVLDQLKQIDASLVVVAIAGLCRTGKSALMNFVAERRDGFLLGKTIESETKGIWALCKIHPKEDGTVMLLLDTEGLGDTEKGDIGHDNRLFILATLLCNILVYNMMSVFNQDVIEKLTFITELSKQISFKNKDVDDQNGRQLDLVLPTFVLCLRDYSLNMQIDGKDYTPDEYLEYCLRLKPGDDDSAKRFNRPRESIRNYFPVRKCFVFDRPGDRKVMLQLETAGISDLSKDFLQDIEVFVNYLHTCRPKVLLSSKPVNGPMFTSLLEAYLKAIRTGAVPDVDDAVKVVANTENERLAEVAVKSFKESVKLVPLPVIKTHEFSEMYNEFKQVTLAQYRLEAVFDTAVHEKRLIDDMDRIWEELKSENLKLIRVYCEGELKQIYENTVGKNKRENKYNVAGGYPLYKFDMGEVKTKYIGGIADTDQYEALDVLRIFMEKETEYENKIMLDDQKLTAKEKRREIERIHTEHKQACEEQQEVFKCKMDEEKQRTEKHNKRIEAERKKYMEKEDSKMKAIMKQWQEQKSLTENQMKVMQTENESQRQQFNAERSSMIKDHHDREERKRKFFEDQNEKERAKHAKQLDERSRNLETQIQILQHRRHDRGGGGCCVS